MNLFDILGPVMVGPSSSHTAGAVRMGLIARQLLGETPAEAEIILHGSFADTGEGHGTDKALVAGLLGFTPDDERIPVSFALAEEAGLCFTILRRELRGAHPNTALLTLKGVNGAGTSVQCASIGGGRIRVDELNGVAVSFTGECNTLVLRHKDTEGRLADIATTLSEAGINIANMNLCRSRRGGDVLTVIETDQRVPRLVQGRLWTLKDILGVTYYEKGEE